MFRALVKQVDGRTYVGIERWTGASIRKQPGSSEVWAINQHGAELVLGNLSFKLTNSDNNCLLPGTVTQQIEY
jgi:hypothetical protein